MDRVTPHFVISAPRSGSTWIMRLLSAHPDVHATEHRLFGPYHDEIIDNEATQPRLRITLDRFADAQARHLNLQGTGLDLRGAREQLIRDLSNALYAFDRSVTRKSVVVDKITPYAGTAANVSARISEIFPESTRIGLIRDGRDVVTSGAHHWLNKRTVDSPDVHRPNPERFFNDSLVEEWSSLWRECTSEAAQASTQIRYESMLANVSTELSAIFTALGVQTDQRTIDACANAGSFGRATGGRPRGTGDPHADARLGIAGDWQRVFTQRDGEIFDSIAGEMLENLGYASRHWWQGLPRTLKQSA